MTAGRATARVLATWFGCGYFPWGPGTVGSAAALAIAIAATRTGNVPPWWFGVFAIATVPVCIWACGMEADTSGRKDPGHIVLDEVIGQWITLAPAATLDTRSALIAFALFRVLDITKPQPARRFEALPSGIGIMADDVMAGIYGALVMALIRFTSI
ncbi:MAG: phosphatidylglycerophosphatase A [Bryobacteraceae bacterium]|nr:phosphatidylglycerophosphatase A [Bryobacteraceae bacterium]